MNSNRPASGSVQVGVIVKLSETLTLAVTDYPPALQANDSDLKNELAKLVGSDAWDAARLVASANARVRMAETSTMSAPL